MTQPIFLSYASQDADAARRICDALRAAGLEVWFDQSELRGGDAWDASIRKQIKECALFVPIISANTEARLEGYFRLEWRLADQRTHLMAKGKPFLLPVVVDDTKDVGAHVPDSFLDAQWTRIVDGNDVEMFSRRVIQLLTPPIALSTTGNGLASQVLLPSREPAAFRDRGATGNDIHPLSVMVMPFANHTGDKDKAYIADAITSSITSDLSRIRDAFIVPAATAFSLQDKKLTVPQLGKEAGVRFLLTGSVMGDKERLRINAVLSDTQTGAQLWAENLDGKQTDLFALQDQVTIRIVNTIGPQMIIVAARDGETRANKPQVADLLMRAKALELNQQSLKNRQAVEVLYRQALALEPDNLNAQIGLAVSLVMQAGNHDSELKLDQAGRVALAKQAADLAEKVKWLDPNDPRVHGVLGTFARLSGDVAGAVLAAKRRVELEPRNSSAHSNLGMAFRQQGDMPSARTALEQALQLASSARPPVEIYMNFCFVAFIEDRADEAIKWAQLAVQANPNWSFSYTCLALAYAGKGDESQARKAAAEVLRLNPNFQMGIKSLPPWPGKEEAFRKYIDTQLLPALRLAGLPE